ncbi:MAG: ribose 5-phosphate isomerase B [Fibrobacteres bacterium]|nr:ribose 5-phosphate isomerase B [Fibrobacterota bacterium]
MKNFRIAIGSDHGGFSLKESLKTALTSESVSFTDFGTHSEASVDYPPFAKEVALAVLSGKADRGILICGTGLGVCYTANRFKGIRAALTPTKEYARLAAAHNNANVLCLGGRFQTPAEASEIVKTWLETEYEGGRHDRRIAMMDE